MILDQDNRVKSYVNTWPACGHFFAHEKMIENFDHLPPWTYVDTEKMLSAGQTHYHGVRVKNTVKELIMKKRNCVDIKLLQSRPEQQPENECPGSKRPSTNTLVPVQHKRPCTNPINVLSGAPVDHASPSLPEHMMSLLQCPPLYTDTGMNVNGSCPLTTSLPDDDTFFTSFPFSQPQTVERPSSSPCQYKFSQAPFQENLPISFFHWQIQQEEEKLAGLTSEQLMAQDEDGDTFLHIAVAQGKRALAYVLAKKMAEIGVLDMKEHNNQSALQLSVAANQHLITQDLLGLGAQLNTTDSWGRSPLHVCAEKGYANTLQAIQKAIQDSGVQINIEAMNYDGWTPLHTAVLSHNAVVQEREQGGDAVPLETLSLSQKGKMLTECIQTLMAMGASCRTKELKSGRTVLHMAAEAANMELLHLFLDQPQHLLVINEKTFSGNTALHITCSLLGRREQVHAVRLLMRKGADPSARNLENEHPAHLVPEGERGDQVRSILKGRAIQVRATCP